MSPTPHQAGPSRQLEHLSEVPLGPSASPGFTCGSHMMSCSLGTGHTRPHSSHPGTGSGCICSGHVHCRAHPQRSHSHQCPRCTRMLCPCGWLDSDTLHIDSDRNLPQSRLQVTYKLPTQLDITCPELPGPSPRTKHVFQFQY